MTAGSNRNDRLLERGREGRALSAGQTAGYIDDAGAARAWRGDRDTPFIKAPPMPSGIDRIFETDALNVASINFYTIAPATDAIDVERARILTLWVQYFAEEDGAIFSVIPEAFNELQGRFTPIGVVDATIVPTMLTPASTLFGSRTVYQQELRSSILQQDDFWGVTLQFEVSSYKRFRFLVADAGDVQAGGECILDISTNV